MRRYVTGIDYTEEEGRLTTYTIDEDLYEDDTRVGIHTEKILIHGDAGLRDEILQLLNRQPQLEDLQRVLNRVEMHLQQMEAKNKEHQAWLHRLEADIKSLKSNTPSFTPLR